MLVVIVGAEKESRRASIHDRIKNAPPFIIFDDTMTDFAALENFAYPSLFETVSPVIWAQFILDKESALAKEKIQALVASKTLFIIEEFAMLADTKKLLEKHGAEVFVHKKEAKNGQQRKPDNAIFTIVQSIIEGDKKTRWMVYQEALLDHVPEAMIGIIYWKLRQLIGYARGAKLEEYKSLYRDIIEAHAEAWKKGVPLALMIEKVLLQ